MSARMKRNRCACVPLSHCGSLCVALTACLMLSLTLFVFQFNAFLDSLERLFIVKAKEVAKGNEIEEKAMARIFKFFDVDGSGELDKEEFAMAMNRFGMPLKQHEIDGFFRR